MKKIAFGFFCSFLFVAQGRTEALTSLEVKCWAEGVDDDGSFFCQYLLAMGKGEDGRFMVPSVLAPDEGGSITRQQADRACNAMGFTHAMRFVVDSVPREENQILISESLREGVVTRGARRIIQHVSCRN